MLIWTNWDISIDQSGSTSRTRVCFTHFGV